MRTKRIALSAVFSALSLIIYSLLSLFSTREIILNLGSDYNGLNSTITQFLSVLILVESGFTVAALVKLYKPYGENDYFEVNRILSKTRLVLRKIGLFMLVGGLAGSAVYGMIIKTPVEYWIVIVLFTFSILSTVFNFSYVYKYRLLFQASQTEYWIYAVNIATHIIMYGGMIFLVRTYKDIIIVRGYALICSVAAGYAIAFIAKRKFPFAKFNVSSDGVKIEGTRDLFVSKLTGLLYNSLSVFYMAVFIGTLQTSVFSVYNSIVSLITNFLQSVLISPQNVLGQVINQEREHLKDVLKEYEHINVLLTSVLLSTTMALIIPFIRIYTANITDTEYIVPVIGVLMVLISAFQMVHIPSGQCIELSGLFKVVKKIQLIAFLSLAILSAIGAYFYGLVGLLFAKLLTNIILATIEVVYTHTIIVPGTLRWYLKSVLLNFLIAVGIAFLECTLLFNYPLNIVGFVFAGAMTVIINTGILLLLNYAFYKKLVKKEFSRLKLLLTRIKKVSA